METYNNNTDSFEKMPLKQFSIFSLPDDLRIQSDKEVEEWERQQEEKRSLDAFMHCGASHIALEKAGFENYVEVELSTYSHLLRQDAETFLNKISDNEPWHLVLTGRPGAGKTFTALCILKEVCKLRKKYTVVSNGMEYTDFGTYDVLYRTAKNMMEDMKSSRNFKSNYNFSQRLSLYGDCKLLCIDEIGRADSKDEKDILFDIIDRREQNGLCTILISNWNWSDLQEKLGEALSSRIRSSLILRETGEDTPDMRGILKYI